jgi:hypothetical protein
MAHYYWSQKTLIADHRDKNRFLSFGLATATATATATKHSKNKTVNEVSHGKLVKNPADQSV